MRRERYRRLIELQQRVSQGFASEAEKREYLRLLLEEGHISEEQYQDYLKGDNSNDIVKAALVIGGAVLVGWLISQLFD